MHKLAAQHNIRPRWGLGGTIAAFAALGAPNTGLLARPKAHNLRPAEGCTQPEGLYYPMLACISALPPIIEVDFARLEAQIHHFTPILAPTHALLACISGPPQVYTRTPGPPTTTYSLPQAYT